MSSIKTFKNAKENNPIYEIKIYSNFPKNNDITKVAKNLQQLAYNIRKFLLINRLYFTEKYNAN